LVVDDDESVCRSTSRLLARIGFEVKTAQSGADALALVASNPVDVIVTDHQMPGMSGAELVERLIAAHPGIAARIILTSGDIHGESTERLIRATGCRAIAKPFTTAELALMIRAVVGAAGPADPPRYGVKSER
jgi:two-component system NtrC family sensor kinase